MNTSRPSPPAERGTLTVVEKGEDGVLSVVDVDGWTIGVVLSPEMAEVAGRRILAAGRRAKGAGQ